ncbi:uncharacterized protein LOC121532576 [Coregonus clupeaformis]|uniref:uncharacterized protein LOC121532576 n=1 Tax=Coregonus clupeaformis TaxID=59861 RepID=UPI001E1C5EF0|nr:uncharacterized protein LOC121532576 [Coregonus clupeaformis]
MVKSYGPERAVGKTLWILRGMDQNDLAEKLETYYRHIRETWWSNSSDADSDEESENKLYWRKWHRALVMKEVSASEKERKPAGEESEEASSKLLRTSSGMWTMSEGECRRLQTEISILKWKLDMLKWRGRLAEANMYEKFAKLPRTSSYVRLTLSEEECRRLETEISRMKVKLEVLKRMLAIPALLLTTLEEMNSQELKTFQSFMTSGLLPDCPPIPESQLENAYRQVTVDQMVKTYGPERVVEITLRILRGMKRVDLAEKLETDHRGGTASTSHLPLFPPRPRSVLSPVWLPPISPLLSRSSSSFGLSKKLLSLTSPGSSGQLRSQEEAASEMERKPAGEESGELPSTSSGMWTLSEGECHLLQTEISWLKVKLDMLKAEFTMYEKFVNMDEQFPKLPRTSFYGRLTLSDEECRDLQAKISRLEEKLRFMKRPFMLDFAVLLLTTLEEMNPNELKTFQSFLTSGQLPDCPPIPERQLENADKQVTVDQMVKTYAPNRAVEITLRILRGMTQNDLAEKLERDYNRDTWWSNSSDADSDEESENKLYWRKWHRALVMKRPSMLDIPALLLTTLGKLSEKQLKRFLCSLTSGQLPGFPPIPERQLQNADRQVTVDHMVKTYAPERVVEITLRILRWMDQNDLAEKLLRDHTRALLLATLEEFTGEQLKTFQSDLTSGQLENAVRQNTVDHMVKRYNSDGAVEITLWILRRMNLDNLAEKLERVYRHRRETWWSNSSDADSDVFIRLRRKRHRVLVMKRPSMLDIPALLLTTLGKLSEEQLKRFLCFLTSGQLPGFPPIPEIQLQNADRQVTVDHMVKRYDSEGAVEITLWILRRMNLDLGDLAEKLERDHRGVLQATQKTLKEMPSSSSHSPPRTPGLHLAISD